MKGNLVNVGAKGSGTVMVLAVYVVRYCPANRHEAGSRRDRKKPSLGKKCVNKIAESDATLATDYSRGFVETQNPVQAMTLNQAAACVEARIAITPAVAKREQGARLGGVENLGYLVIPSRFVYLTMIGPWIATPGKNMLGVRGGWRAFACGQGRR